MKQHFRDIFVATIGVALSFSASAVNFQSVSGNGNHTINNQAGGLVNYSLSEPSPATRDVADSLNKIVRFLEATNPTKIYLGDVRLLRWLGEDEKVLTLDIKNSSNMPGYKVKTVLLASLNHGESQSRLLSMKPVRGFTKKMLETLSVEAQGAQSIPIATVSELKRFVNFPEGYDLIGAGLVPEIPDVLIHEYGNQNKNSDGSMSLAFMAMGFGVRTTYETVFEGKNSSVMSAFLYFAKPEKPIPMLVFPHKPD